MNRIRATAAALVAALLLSAGLAVAATPAYASCGDTTAEWVDPVAGSAWSGVFTDDSSTFTVVLGHDVLGVRAAVTVVAGLSGTGTGVWVHDYDTRWSAAVAGLWELHFEVVPDTCSGGDVTSAAGAAVDGLSTYRFVQLTRTL
ncbi:MAG TPA: hypothetical protein VFY84_19240 [Jiangellales bacterium]|nr:hypothetical protein [Jiangellales bacterium]